MSLTGGGLHKNKCYGGPWSVISIHKVHKQPYIHNSLLLYRLISPHKLDYYLRPSPTTYARETNVMCGESVSFYGTGALHPPIVHGKLAFSFLFSKIGPSIGN